MAKKRRSKKTATADYRHEGHSRANIPPAKIEAEGAVPDSAPVRYAYNPHLQPTLRVDPSGFADRCQQLIELAQRGALSAPDLELLRGLVRDQSPWLEWTGRQEEHDRRFLGVEPVVLHMHERVSARAIVHAALRKDIQRDLFADPQQPYEEAVQFYQHGVDWTNRLILGDSLLVMSSLANREGLAGKVKMIYMDPPYGVNFRSNFQPITSERSVKEQEADLVREPESVKAYRDTWKLGVHSYLTYLRDRFLLCRELLASSGSIFVQISDDHVHRVRHLLDAVFGRDNFVSQVVFTKGPGGLATSKALATRFDYLLWYARDKSQLTTNKLYVGANPEDSKFKWIRHSNGEIQRLSQLEDCDVPTDAVFFDDESLTKPGPGSKYEVEAFGRTFTSGKRWWGTPKDALERALRAERVIVVGNTLRRVKYLHESVPKQYDNLWADLSGPYKPVFVVQTNDEVIRRCMLLATSPGDLVLDPTCGSGTTAFVAETWGRRWITVDTARVAVFLARQRLLTSTYPYFKTQIADHDGGANPGSGFIYKKLSNVTFSTVSQNTNLDPILDEHEVTLTKLLAKCNSELAAVTDDLKALLADKLSQKEQAEGRRLVTEAERRRWLLPPYHRLGLSKADGGTNPDLNAAAWQLWEVPFDSDPSWPKGLQEAIEEFRKAWAAKESDVSSCIAANALSEELIDQPEVVPGVVRVSGPFTVEGVRPPELSRLQHGSRSTQAEPDPEHPAETSDTHAYLSRMVQLLRNDGVTFPGNIHRGFQTLEPLYAAKGRGENIHAEGTWSGSKSSDPLNVAVAFGPQHGPVTALQVEELIRSARRYDELVVAGFSFDAEASAVLTESNHPKLRVHQAYVRPDVNPVMDGLLRETPNSQLFTIFGQPEIELLRTKTGWVCSLKGVDVYDPLESTVRSTGASKVAAWFLDQDYDGRCFCVSQAFFPNSDAWGKIAKSLRSAADEDVFDAFSGTQSIPFEAGRYNRIAVKVIDPRGNEVMSIRRLDEQRKPEDG